MVPWILVAEDDPLSRRLLVATLQARGYEVVDVVDGTAAWERCNAGEPPAIAIFDWMMPGLTGLEVCQRLRAQLDRPYTYVMLLTARSRDQDLLDGYAAGVDDFVVKPYSPDHLLARVQAAERVMSVMSAPRGLASALREAAASPGGDLVVRAGDVVGRVLFHGGRVAWVHLSSEPGSLVDVLRGEPDGVSPEDVRAVLAESAASGRNFAEVLIDWELISLEALRERVRRWLEAKLQTIVGLDGAFTMFAPQPRSYRGELTYTLAELLPAGLPRRATSRPMPAAAPLPGGPVMEAEPSEAVATALRTALAVTGVRAAALFDAERRVCLGRLGAEVDGGLALRLMQMLHHEAGERIEDAMLSRGRRFHLIGATSSQRHFVYLELDRAVVNLAQARLTLRAVAEKVAVDGL
jgi:CheY-like chemotaxis protein